MDVLDSFNVFKRVSPRAASKRVRAVLKKHRGGALEEKKFFN